MFRHLFCTLLLFAPAVHATPLCGESPLRRGGCFEVRGRLEAGNGNPSWRIRPAGSHRVLGVLDSLRSPASSENGGLPSEVSRAALQSQLPNNAVLARFTVCPLSRDIPGHMRAVCIAGMK